MLTSIISPATSRVVTVRLRGALSTIASTALRIRFTSTCWIWIRSTKTREASAAKSRLTTGPSICRLASASPAPLGAHHWRSRQRQGTGLSDDLAHILDALVGFSLANEVLQPLH